MKKVENKGEGRENRSGMATAVFRCREKLPGGGKGKGKGEDKPGHLRGERGGRRPTVKKENSELTTTTEESKIYSGKTGLRPGKKGNAAVAKTVFIGEKSQSK